MLEKKFKQSKRERNTDCFEKIYLYMGEKRYFIKKTPEISLASALRDISSLRMFPTLNWLLYSEMPYLETLLSDCVLYFSIIVEDFSEKDVKFRVLD